MLIYTAHEKMVMQYFMSKLSKKTALRGCHFLKNCFATKALLIFLAFTLILVCQY